MTTYPVPTYHCQCGEAYGESCAWSGAITEMEVVEWMPEYLRGSHTAAGNSGVYPPNGVCRLAVHHECASLLEESEGDPDTWPDGCEWFARVTSDPTKVAEYADEEEIAEVV